MAAKAKKSGELSITRFPGVAIPAAQPAAGLSYAEFAAFGRDNIEAVVKTGAALSAGAEAIGQEVMGYARAALKSASETARGLLGAKTLDDVVRLQTDLARRHFEEFVAGSMKLSELGMSVASEAFAPWEGRVEATMARLTHAPAGKSPTA